VTLMHENKVKLSGGTIVPTRREKFICVVHLENMIRCLILCQLVQWLCRFRFFAG
jgi:hypothetical protein